MECGRTHFTSKEFERQIGNFKSKAYVAFDRILLVGKLLDVQHKVERRLSWKEVCPSWDEGAAGERIRRGLPAVDCAGIYLDGELLRELLKDVRHVLTGCATGEAAHRLLSAESSGQILLSEFVKRTVSGDLEYVRALSEDWGCNDVEGFITLASVLVSPFLRCCAGALPPAPAFGSVSSSWCPACGGVPLMARLRREDGQRLLECSVCGAQWVFERLKCPFCLNEDQGTLGYFFVEDESAYRVDTCDECQGYIKTVDERVVAVDLPTSLVVTDAATLYLDILAKKKNYRAISELAMDV